MLRFYSLILMLSFSYEFHAQVYDDFLGAGNTIGMKVSSSSQEQNDSNSYVITGTQLKPDLIGASRFLSQATLGVSYEDIENLTDIGIDAWLDEQFNLPIESFTERYDELYDEINGIIPEDDHLNRYMSFVFYEKLVKEPDLLRQKVAFALSQIFVISPYHGSTISGFSDANVVYYDYLYEGAFGNYKDILTNISLSLPMGSYLSHFMNQKADIVENTFPDENYAREIMQLFSIGLNELNQDGTPVLDAEGNTIPTYDIDNITEMAKVFTGLGVAETGDGSPNTNFFRTFDVNRRSQMIMFQEYHSKQEKNILPGFTIPAGQPGMDDINQAIDILFNHPNVAPFLSKRLIQHLVKSNPSPAYVNRISTIFNNNGSGVRGDFAAVVKAILLDPEARNCDWLEDNENGKLIQPLERFTTLFKAFDIATPSGRIWYDDFSSIYDETSQSFLSSPTVFNFFSPFYAEDEFVSPKDLVSPEFEILNSITAIAYINEMENSIKIRPFRNLTTANIAGTNLGINSDDEPLLDFTDELALYQNQGVDAMLDRLNLILCRGQLLPGTHDIIANAIMENVENVNGYDAENALEDALYFIMMTPDYLIQK